MVRAPWLDEARLVPLPEVAAAVGIPVGRSRRLHRCPAGCEHEGPDSAAKVYAGHDGEGRYHCHRCGKGGDVIDLAAYGLFGHGYGDLSDDDRRGVRDWFGDHGWATSGASTSTKPPTARLRPQPPTQSGTPTQSRLPRAEVDALWDQGWPVVCEVLAQRFLYSRGLEPWRIDALRLVRSLPERARCPRWASCARERAPGDWQRWTWAEHADVSHLLPEARSVGAWNLLIPCYDATGTMVGLKARWTGADWDDDAGEWCGRPSPLAELDEHGALVRDETGKSKDRRKETSPRGEGVLRGTVYADPVGQWLLRSGPDARPGDDVMPGLRWNGIVIVVEGGPCWLRYASEVGRVTIAADGAGETYAVLGVWSGAWPDDAAGDALAARLAPGPDGARIVLVPDVDDDHSGEKLMERIAATLVRAGIAHRIAKLDELTGEGGEHAGAR